MLCDSICMRTKYVVFNLFCHLIESAGKRRTPIFHFTFQHWFCCYCCCAISHFRHKHIELIKNNSKIIYNFLRVICVFLFILDLCGCVCVVSVSFHSLAEWNATDEFLYRSENFQIMFKWLCVYWCFFCLRLNVVCIWESVFFYIYRLM